jgi:DNA processing protein
MDSAFVASDHATLLALAELVSPSLNGASSFRLADAIEVAALAGDGMDLLVTEDRAWIEDALRRLDPSRVSFWRDELHRLAGTDVRLVTTADDEYPTNLRMIHNRPPFLFVRGSLGRDDERAIAVVGTRKPSAEGDQAASEIAGELVRRNVTVISGLAEGIDTAAHRGALNAGGRTIAVFGTGIELVFPARNRSLAQAVSRSGACVSQFWPTLRGARWTFPVRNVVTSGLSLGTVVVEAGETSGARLQAEDAIGHGKRVFLLRHLVTTQPWAQAICERPEVAVVDSVDEVARAIDIDLAIEPNALL